MKKYLIGIFSSITGSFVTAFVLRLFEINQGIYWYVAVILAFIVSFLIPFLLFKRKEVNISLGSNITSKESVDITENEFDISSNGDKKFFSDIKAKKISMKKNRFKF